MQKLVLSAQEQLGKLLKPIIWTRELTSGITLISPLPPLFAQISQIPGLILRYPWDIRVLISQIGILYSRVPKFNPWLRKIPWRRAWQYTLVFLPGESMDRGAWRPTASGAAKSQMWISDWHSHFHFSYKCLLDYQCWWKCPDSLEISRLTLLVLSYNPGQSRLWEAYLCKAANTFRASSIRSQPHPQPYLLFSTSSPSVLQRCRPFSSKDISDPKFYPQGNKLKK